MRFYRKIRENDKLQEDGLRKEMDRLQALHQAVSEEATEEEIAESRVTWRDYRKSMFL